MNRLPAFAIAIILPTLALAGPLTPPPGPVTSTHKTLTEIEPRIAINAANTPGDADSLFKITLPGSYYLLGNITGVVGKHGIEIAANGVTLDLNGFDLVGIPGMGTFDGVTVTVASLSNIAVLNGSIRDWGSDGVDLGTIVVDISRVESVLASGNIGNGVRVGNGGVITNCAATTNGGGGIFAGNGCTISNCSASVNTGTGISSGSTCSIMNCSAFDNSGSGFGIADGCTISNCTASFNTFHGIGPRSNVVLTGSTIVDCCVRGNTLDGILFASNCIVRGNNCNANGNAGGNGAGIHATAGDNRIEGNICTGGDRGVDVDLAGNFIIRNTCSGATVNWDIVAGNACLVINAALSGAISGSNGGVGPGSTDPNANFTY